MFNILEKRVAAAFASSIESLYGVTAPVQTEQPKQSSFGEIARELSEVFVERQD